MILSSLQRITSILNVESIDAGPVETLLKQLPNFNRWIIRMQDQVREEK